MGWTRTRAVVRDVICPADDGAILGAIERAAKTGIDCPFGWPNALVEFVAAHRAGHVPIPRYAVSDGWRRELTFHSMFGIEPGAALTGPADLEGASRIVLQLPHPNARGPRRDCHPLTAPQLTMVRRHLADHADDR